MRIENSFTLAMPVEDAWGALLDVGRTAPCLPGVELQEVGDDGHRGALEVTLGGIPVRYEGTARFAQVDEAGRRFVLEAEGHEAGGGSDATATVTVTLVSAGDGRTDVTVATELTVGGPVAALDDSVLTGATSEVLAAFGRCLERGAVPAGEGAPAAPAPTVSEIVADEVAEMAVEDPERASRFVSAVAPAAPLAPPAGPSPAAGPAPSPMAQRALPAAIVGVFLLQGLVKGRLRRWGLAVLGSALVAGMVSGKQQQRR